MTTELWSLVWTAVLALVIPTIYGTGRMQMPGGMQWALGNRDEPLAAPAWAGRALRAHANLVENLAPFAILVLAAQIAGKTNGWTALGAQLFLWARIAHVAIYTAGWIGVRTAVFFIGTVGELLILFQLFR
jgi:uncharacterized MAPEG superfamily protein